MRTSQKGNPLEDCVVLNAYDEYTECKVNCKLNKKEDNGEDIHS